MFLSDSPYCALRRTRLDWSQCGQGNRLALVKRRVLIGRRPLRGPCSSPLTRGKYRRESALLAELCSRADGGLGAMGSSCLPWRSFTSSDLIHRVAHECLRVPFCLHVGARFLPWTPRVALESGLLVQSPSPAPFDNCLPSISLSLSLVRTLLSPHMPWCASLRPTRQISTKQATRRRLHGSQSVHPLPSAPFPPPDHRLLLLQVRVIFRVIHACI